MNFTHPHLAEPMSNLHNYRNLAVFYLADVLSKSFRAPTNLRFLSQLLGMGLGVVVGNNTKLPGEMSPMAFMVNFSNIKYIPMKMAQTRQYYSV